MLPLRAEFLHNSGVMLTKPPKYSLLRHCHENKSLFSPPTKCCKPSNSLSFIHSCARQGNAVRHCMLSCTATEPKEPYRSRIVWLYRWFSDKTPLFATSAGLSVKQAWQQHKPSLHPCAAGGVRPPNVTATSVRLLLMLARADKEQLVLRRLDTRFLGGLW